MEIKRIIRRPIESHLAFSTLWALLVILASYLYEGTLLTLGVGLGLAALAAGLVIFLAPRRETPLGWTALIAGQCLSVILGSVLLAGPGSPLLLLLLWPLAWAAFILSDRAGLGVVVGAAVVYLAVGIWHGSTGEEPGATLLGMVLYLGVYGGSFALLRLLVRADSGIPPAPPATTTPSETPEPVAATKTRRSPGEGPAAARPRTAAASRSVAPPPATATPPKTERPPEDPLHQDLRVARDIQVSLLLASSPRLPGWEAGTSFLPARELGGDLYDFIELGANRWGVMIGDVTGKGIPAALHMAVTRTLFRVEAYEHPNPALALKEINRALIEQVPQGCVTMLYVHLDIAKGELCMANAGHNYPLLLRESVRELTLSGLPLGIDNEYHYREICASLQPGDVLIFYTDGVVEATNGQGELFGFDRLQHLLENGTSRRPRTLTRQIVRAVRSFTGGVPQSDDITLLVLRRRYQDPQTEIIEVARDVLGGEGAEIVRQQLEGIDLPKEISPEDWRAVILTLGSSISDHYGQGASRELMQQLFLTLESLSESWLFVV